MNIVDLQQENAPPKAQLQKKIHYIQQLEEALWQLRHRHSEKLSTDQLGLFNDAEEQAQSETFDAIVTDESVAVQTHQRRVQHVRTPAGIPRKIIVHDLPDSEKFCPHNGTPLKEIGGEQHEQLDPIPAQLKAIVHLRKKCACACCERHVVTAAKSKQPIEKTLPASACWPI